MTRRMQTLSNFDVSRLGSVRGVFTDIDDTLTTHGRIDAETYAALENLRRGGLLVIPITGRPAGWCDMIARSWPVDAVVGENGAFYFRYDDSQKRMLRGYHDNDQTRAANRKRLDVIAADVLASVRGAAISADQPYREADLAIDFCEDVPPLRADDIARVAAIFRSHGATAKVSSIHVNGWFGAYDKLTMTRRLMRDVFQVDLDSARADYVFVGDSPNDAPMFGFFQHSVGVANVAMLADQCEPLPAFVSLKPYGAGFVEVADLILRARRRV
jgi:HAD superfamily hydrolase (TIGR01484 family)